MVVSVTWDVLQHLTAEIRGYGWNDVERVKQMFVFFLNRRDFITP